MLKQAVPVLLVLSILLSSCSKSGDSVNNGGNTGGNTPNPPAAYLTHTTYFAQYNLAGTAISTQGQVFEYDKANNKVTIYEADTTSGSAYADTITYQLTGDIVTIKHKKTPLVQTYYLNAAHTYQDSLWLVNGSVEGAYSYVHNFDASNQLTDLTHVYTQYSNGNPSQAPVPQTSHYTWQSGNLIKIDNSTIVYNYTYDENVLAAPADPVMNIVSPGQGIVACKNIKKTSNITIVANNGVLTSVFTYDDKGRVIKTTGTSEDGTTTLNTTTYY